MSAVPVPANPWHIPRYQPQNELPTLATPALPPPRRAAPPTTRRPAPRQFCFLCGATVPPWRAVCFDHDRRQGRGLAPPARLRRCPPAEIDDYATTVLARVSAW